MMWSIARTGVPTLSRPRPGRTAVIGRKPVRNSGDGMMVPRLILEPVFSLRPTRGFNTAALERTARAVFPWLPDYVELPKVLRQEPEGARQ
jgi:hypothetical protein